MGLLLQNFWPAMVADVNAIGEVTIIADPLVFLLGITNNLPTNTHVAKLFIFYATYYARKTILPKWKTPDPPTIIGMEICG